MTLSYRTSANVAYTDTPPRSLRIDENLRKILYRSSHYYGNLLDLVKNRRTNMPANLKQHSKGLPHAPEH